MTLSTILLTAITAMLGLIASLVRYIVVRFEKRTDEIIETQKMFIEEISALKNAVTRLTTQLEVMERRVEKIETHIWKI